MRVFPVQSKMNLILSITLHLQIRIIQNTWHRIKKGAKLLTIQKTLIICFRKFKLLKCIRIIKIKTHTLPLFNRAIHQKAEVRTRGCRQKSSENLKKSLHLQRYYRPKVRKWIQTWPKEKTSTIKKCTKNSG